MKYILVQLLLMYPVFLFGQNLTETVKGNNLFAFDLYKELQKAKENQNLFFSPFSISSALAMTYAGARNETEKVMSRTLYFTMDQQLLHDNFNTLLSRTNRNQNGIQLNIANALWAQKEYTFLDSYFQLVTLKYSAGLEYVNFRNNKDRELARLKINQWVEDKTNDKIKELIKEGILNDMSRLVLVNVIYFLGKWETEFKKELTKQDTFHITKEKTVQILFMHQISTLKYFENEELQAVEIPYEGEKTSMVIILLRNRQDKNKFKEAVSYKQYIETTANMKMETVELYIPKLKATGDFRLEDPLSALGMSIAFSDKADFSGMTGSVDLQIDKVIHQSFIEVSEEGTEAAAATAVIMREKTVSENKIFKANQPFMLFIKDNETESILFMGNIVNPDSK